MPYRVLLLLAFCLGLTFCLALAAAGARAQPPLGALEPLGEPPAGAQVVTVGFFPNTVYDLDLNDSTYYVDTYIWFRWRGPIDPTATLELVNLVDDWGLTQEKQHEEPQILSDGSSYQMLRIQGRFFQSFLLSDFPLDQQRLHILIEDSVHPASELVYRADSEDSGYSDLLRIPGWLIDGWEAEPLLHRYGSTFGDSGGVAEEPYAAFRFELIIERPLNYFLWKLLLPLLIVLSANWTVLLLHPRLIEVRTAMPASALLTLVFLQQSYSNSLPDVGYLVLLDKIYACAYLLIIATLIQVIVLAARGGRSEDETTARRFVKDDHISLVAQVSLFVLATLAIVLLR